MKKQLNLNKKVYELCETYPELIEILSKVGFTEITKKNALNTVGKLMTIPKVAKLRGVDLADVIAALEKAGFTVEEPVDHVTLLKSYLERLNNKEDLDSIRKDFAQDFEGVDPFEILQAEEAMILEGMPYSEVQKLCDVHSALFHGSAKEEQVYKAELAVEDSLRRQGASVFVAIPGHPLSTLTLENEILAMLIDEAQHHEDDGKKTNEIFDKIQEVSIHYAKKGDLIYPLLKEEYGIHEQVDAMWTEDDEIRDTFQDLTKEKRRNKQWKERYFSNLQRAEEMIYKETNILFPLCAQTFTKKDWEAMYWDSLEYEPCLMNEIPVWENVKPRKKETKIKGQEIVLPAGKLNVKQLRALLDTIPMEISFVDEEDVNRYFNEGYKVFKRPNMALNRKAISCFPPQMGATVQQILEDFKTGREDSVDMLMEKCGKIILVRYMAVRDEENNYLGTAEFVQNMEDIRRIIL